MAKQKRIYTMWCNIKARCYRKTSPDFKLYGARGIKMCDEWINDSKKFIDWAQNNGYADNLTIERIDINKGYGPSNCIFISNEEQALNRRTRIDNKLGQRGICIKNNKYVVRLSLNKQRKYIGSFNTLNEAIDAKNEFINKHSSNRICKEII